MIDTILVSRRLFEGWLSVALVRWRLNGQEVEWPLIEHPSGAAVLAYDPARRVALTVRQTRLAVLHTGRAPFPETIAGVVEAGDPEATARQGAVEEAGVVLRDLEPVGRI